MVNNLEEGVKVVEVLEAEEGDETDKTSTGRATVECYKCHKLGHFQWECQSKEKETNYAETQEEMLLMVYVNMNKANREDMLFLDSGCSNHMCGKKEYVSDFDGSFRDSVKLGNNSSMVVTEWVMYGSK